MVVQQQEECELHESSFYETQSEVELMSVCVLGGSVTAALHDRFHISMNIR